MPDRPTASASPPAADRSRQWMWPAVSVVLLAAVGVPLGWSWWERGARADREEQRMAAALRISEMLDRAEETVTGYERQLRQAGKAADGFAYSQASKQFFRLMGSASETSRGYALDPLFEGRMTKLYKTWDRYGYNVSVQQMTDLQAGPETAPPPRAPGR